MLPKVQDGVSMGISVTSGRTFTCLAGNSAKPGGEDGGGRKPADAVNPETEPEEMIELQDGRHEMVGFLCCWGRRMKDMME